MGKAEDPIERLLRELHADDPTRRLIEAARDAGATAEEILRRLGEIDPARWLLEQIRDPARPDKGTADTKDGGSDEG